MCTIRVKHGDEVKNLTVKEKYEEIANYVEGVYDHVKATFPDGTPVAFMKANIIYVLND